MSKYIKENELLNLTKLFIYDNDELVGIPIGNYTSQYFANIYLNELDKLKLRVQYAKIILLDFAEKPLKEIQGRIRHQRLQPDS